MTINKVPNISVVSPVCGRKNCLFELCSRLKETLANITTNFEISMVKGMNLSRNFGQHYVITAGLNHCQDAWVK